MMNNNNNNSSSNSSSKIFPLKILVILLSTSQTICFSTFRTTTRISHPQTNRIPRQSRQINLAIDPNDVLNNLELISQHGQQHLPTVMNGVQDHGELLMSSLPSTSLASFPFFGGGIDEYQAGMHILPTGAGSGTVALPDVAAAVLSGPKLQIMDADMQAIIPTMSNDARTAKFVTRELSFMSKIPLAALVYGSFEFFFMNQKRTRDMYYGEDYEDMEEDEGVQLAEFVSTVGLRLGAAFVIVGLTFLVSS